MAALGKMIFQTVHGSRLYGFDHKDSDYDLFKVYEGKDRKLYQSVVGKNDVVIGTLEGVVLRAFSGSHQSAAAIFSPKKEWAPGMEEKWGPYLKNIRLGVEAQIKYERTIKKFVYGDFKKRRHAARLAHNLRGLKMNGGQFSPRLPQIDASLCAAYAQTFEGDALLDQLRDMMYPTGFDIG